MIRINRNSLKIRLTFYMVVIAVSSIVVMSMIIGYEFSRRAREKAIVDAKSSLSAVSYNVASALDFDDKVVVDESLAILGRIKEFVLVKVVLQDGSLFSQKVFKAADEKFLEEKEDLVSIKSEIVGESGDVLGFLEAKITMEYVFREGVRYILTLCFIGGIVLMVTSIIIFFLISKAVYPVEALKKSIEKISKRGFIGNVDVISKDEIGSLAQAFNIMANELQSSAFSRKYVDNIIQSMLDMLFVLEPDGKIKTVNKAAIDILGYREDELAGHDISLIFTEEEISLIKTQGFQKLIKKGSIVNYETHFKTKDGKRIPALLSCAVMRDDGKELLGIVMIAKNITERKKAEVLKEINQQLKINEQELKAANEELAEKIEETNKLNKTMTGRELRIIEVKEEVNKLSKELNRPAPYKLE